MVRPIPQHIEDISRDWLSHVLGREITGFRTSIVEGGVLASTYRLDEISYAPARDSGTGSDAPASVIVKLPSPNAVQRASAHEAGVYRREVEFFRTLANEVPLRSPGIHVALTDEEAGDGSFVLVMEDLDTHSRVFDPVNDPPDVAFCEKLALEVAGMHARFWRSPALEAAPIEHAGEYRFPIADLFLESPARLSQFEDAWRRLFGREALKEGGCEGAETLTHLVCGTECAAILARIHARLSSRPHTLLHGDLRASNVFRTDPARGLSPEESQLTYVDWQLLGAGPPGPDLAQAWISSLPPEIRQEDHRILHRYHERLVALQPAAAEYDYEMLLEDYVLGAVLWWGALVSVGANALALEEAKPSESMKTLWSTCLPWLLTALQDHDALGRVRALLDGEGPG